MSCWQHPNPRGGALAQHGLWPPWCHQPEMSTMSWDAHPSRSQLHLASGAEPGVSHPVSTTPALSRKPSPHHYALWEPGKRCFPQRWPVSPSSASSPNGSGNMCLVEGSLRPRGTAPDWRWLGQGPRARVMVSSMGLTQTAQLRAAPAWLRETLNLDPTQPRVHVWAGARVRVCASLTGCHGEEDRGLPTEHRPDLGEQSGSSRLSRFSLREPGPSGRRAAEGGRGPPKGGVGSDPSSACSATAEVTLGSQD